MNKENYILICASGKYDLWYKNGSFYYSTTFDSGNKIKIGDVFNLDIPHVSLSRKRISQRALRLTPRCGIFTTEEEAIVSFHGRVLDICIPLKEIHEEHRFREGMNNPLSFAKIQNVSGFKDRIVYGEYFGNNNEQSVRIYERTQEGKWESLYSFSPGTINHIHGIIPDKNHSCIYVLTGDTDKQSGIWKITNDFNSTEVLLSGNQQFRTCVVFPYGNGICFATDTPLQSNGIYYYDFSNKKVEKIIETEGPCIYGRKVRDDQFILSTSVEPDSRLKGWHYRLSYRRGYGVKSWYSCVYAGNPDTGFRIVLKKRKDFLPMLLFGFGTFLFPNDESGNVRLVGQSVRGLDGKTIQLQVGVEQ